ncbi:MAG TPA: hypothetical protein VLG27_02940 [Candidatus Saccharimonadia bacterium]|nr:hypothetical protein [Candidatus Saccharimonadia bacterium]
MRVLLSLLAVFVILVANEIWWRKRRTHGEFSRKFVHVTVGSFVAFWPFFLSWRTVEWLSLAFVVVVLISKALNIFTAIHSVQRLTWGELCFALSVGTVAFATHDKWIYMASLLQMSIADGLAAVVGVRFGRSNTYTILKRTKSMVGTLTFFVASVIILTVYKKYSGDHLTTQFIIGLSVLASLLENVSINGLDNLFVPLVVALFLSR